MNSLKKFISEVAALLALALLLAAGCADTPKDPDTNNEPNTSITSYIIDTAPDSATFYNVTVNWRWSDKDGEAVAFRYWVDTGDTTETYDTNAIVRLDFPNSTTTYTFYVQAKDNSNDWDATAASRVIDITETRDITDPAFMPSTAGITVPPNGASTSRGVPFAISGTDVDGIVTDFQWAVDDPTSWTTVTPDIVDVSSSAGVITLGPATLTLGTHIVYFRSLDNMANVDPSPLSISINVEAGYAPEVVLSVADGQSFIVPYTAPTLEDFTVTVTATVDFYYGQIDSFVVSTSEGASFTSTETEIVLGDLGSGDYWVDITAWDAGENSTATGQVSFSILELAADNGVLCVNGIDWGTYGSDADDIWESGVPWGNRTNFKTWDLFDTSPLYSDPDFGDNLLGKGGGVPAWMLDTDFFEAISWFGNNFSGDQAHWSALEDEIIAYLEMGGNILLPVRYGSTWFWDELNTYCGVDPDAWNESPAADILTAKVGTLADINAETGQSLWHIPMTSGNLWIYEAATAAPGMHAGFITLPNGDGGGGAFCYIAGRSYRWETADMKAAVDVILNTYFGVQ